MRCNNHNCLIGWTDRDWNAAKNMARIGFAVFYNKRRPQYLMSKYALQEEQEMQGQLLKDNSEAADQDQDEENSQQQEREDVEEVPADEESNEED